MKGSIISPLWFYLIDVLHNFEFFVEFVYIFIIPIPFLVYWLIKTFNEEDKDKYFIKKIIIAFFVFVSLDIAIPSKETMYTMMVANAVTYENVEIATDAIKDSVDYIMDKLDDDKKDNQKEDTKDTNEGGEI